MQRIIKGIGLRRLFYLLLAIGFISCGEDPVLNVSAPDGTEFLMSGGTKKVVVKSDGGWFLSFAWSSDDGNWLITSVTSGKGEQDIYVTAHSNTTTKTRRVVLTFTSSDDADVKAVLEFTQLGLTNTLKLSSENVTLAALSGNQRALTIESNTEWTVQADKDWIKVSKSSGVGTDDIVISGDVNKGDERRGILTISTSNQSLSKQIIVTQEGGSDVIYQEPYTKWDASMSDVLEHTQDYTILLQGANILALNGIYKEQNTGYIFDSGRLAQAVPVIDYSVTSISELSENLQGYGYVLGKNTLDGFPTFVSNDGKNFVTIEDNTSSNVFLVRYKSNERLFTQPYFRWSASKETVKKALVNRGYTLVDEEVTNEGYALTFSGMYMEYASVYSFDRTQGLIYYVLFFDPAATTVNKLRSFLSTQFLYSFISETADKTGYLYQSKESNNKVLIRYPNEETKYISMLFISSSYVGGYENRIRMRTKALTEKQIYPHMNHGLLKGETIVTPKE